MLIDPLSLHVIAAQHYCVTKLRILRVEASPYLRILTVRAQSEMCFAGDKAQGEATPQDTKKLY